MTYELHIKWHICSIIFLLSVCVGLFFCPKDILKLKWVNITIQQKYFPGEHKKLLWSIKKQIIFEEKELGFFAFFMYNTLNPRNISSTYIQKTTYLYIQLITTTCGKNSIKIFWINNVIKLYSSHAFSEQSYYT